MALLQPEKAICDAMPYDHYRNVRYQRKPKMKLCPISSVQHGFTLVEVMIALTIIAISLGALLSSSGHQASNATYLKQKTLAHWVALNELAEIRISREFPDVGDKKGSTTMANYDWYWIRTTKKTEDKDALEVTFTMYADQDYQQNLTTLIGYATR